MSFNTAIAQMVIFINAAFKERNNSIKRRGRFIKVIVSRTTHITEIWNKLGHENTISYEKWWNMMRARIVDDKEVNLKTCKMMKVRFSRSSMNEEQEKVKTCL